MSKRLFLTGGSGFVGRSFIEYIIKKHYPHDFSHLVILSRSETADKAIKLAVQRGLGDKNMESFEGYSIVRGDLQDIDALVNMIRGCEFVFHSAAKVDPWGPWEEFVVANIIGTQNLLEASKRAGARRFTHVSTEALLLTGLNNGCLQNVDETAPRSLNPPFYAPYTQSKALAEKAVVEANDPGKGFETVTVRPRFIWGRGDTTLIPRIRDAILDGRFKWFTPEATSDVSHIANVCEGMVCAALRGKPGEVYFITDGKRVVLNEFIKKLLHNFDTTQAGSVSGWFVWNLAIIIENLPFMGYGVTREPPINRQVLGLFIQDVLLSDAKARREIGYTSHMTHEEGIADFIEYDREEMSRI